MNAPHAPDSPVDQANAPASGSGSPEGSRQDASFVSKTVFTFTVFHRTDSPFTVGIDNDMDGDGPFDSELGWAMRESFDGHAIGHETKVSTTPVPVDLIPEFFSGDCPDMDCPRCGSEETRFVPLEGHLPYECDECGHLYSPADLNLGTAEDEQMPDDEDQPVD